MENKNEFQDLSLDEMLSELHELMGDDLPQVDVEPDEELKELLDLPDLDISPVTVKDVELSVKNQRLF